MLSRAMYTQEDGGGTPISNGYGCKAHTSKGLGIRWERTLKKWGVIAWWEAKFWFKIRRVWVRMLLLIFQWALGRNLEKKNVENGKYDQFVDDIETKSSFLWQPNAKNRESLGESD